MYADPSDDPRPARVRRPALMLGLAGAVLLAELALVGTLFKHGIAFRCLSEWPRWACGGASGAMLSALCALAALALAVALRPGPLRALLSGGAAGAAGGPCRAAVIVNLTGLGVALAPLAVLRPGGGAAMLWPALGAWAAGLVLMALGAALAVAPAGRWGAYLRAHAGTLVPALAAGLLAPPLATAARPLWQIETIADWTFRAVAWCIARLGYAVDTLPADKIIGTPEFWVRIANVCSGIEGMALVTVFVTLYLWLFRADLRFPRALLLYPIGLAASVAFNVLRITLLLVIGLEGNPDLAVGGFHSHAGWLMFTLVALGLVALAQTVPALHRAAPVGTPGTAVPAAAPVPPLRRDPVAARILPFAVFMASALLASTLSSAPALVYPLRVAAMAAAVALFWPIYRALPWRPDPVALAVGAAVGLAWALIPVATPEGPSPLTTLGGAALAAWLLARGAGTILLVPLIEELFFRGYLERRLAFGAGRAWTLVGVLLSTAAFAALHDRWAEAFLAGLAFSWVMRRHGRVTDAVLAHAVANAVVFAAALATWNLAVI